MLRRRRRSIRWIFLCKFVLMDRRQILEKFWLLLKILLEQISRFFHSIVTEKKETCHNKLCRSLLLLFDFSFQIWPISLELYNLAQCHKLLVIDVVCRFFCFILFIVPIHRVADLLAYFGKFFFVIYFDVNKCIKFYHIHLISTNEWRGLVLWTHKKCTYSALFIRPDEATNGRNFE